MVGAGLTVSEIVGEGGSADGAVLIAKCGAEVVAVDDVIAAPVIIALVRSMVCAGPAALIDRAEQKLCQAVPSQARHRVVGEPAAEAEVIAPAREIPVAIAAPHQTGLQGVRANDFRYVVQNREGIFALDRVLPLLRPEAG